MGVQSQAWLDGIGDEWLDRNRADLGVERDLICEFIESHNIPLGRVYEIGCSNGWRLKKLQDLGWAVCGIDPSKKAIREARKLLHRPIAINVATADEASDFAPECDVVILGYCMCLVDPMDWPKVVGEVDRVLKPGGYLLVEDRKLKEGLDFKHWDVTFEEHQGKYQSFDMNVIYWPKLWAGFPSYRLTAEANEEGKHNVCFAFHKGEFWHGDA